MRAIGVSAGYGFIALIGLWLLAVGGNALRDMADAGTPTGIIVLSAAFVIGAAAAVFGVLYELRAHGAERLRRHWQTQKVSLVILAMALVAYIAWPVLPGIARVCAASAAAGFMLGFLGAFIPNRSRALSIRTIDDKHDEPDRAGTKPD
jgi:hypothetical protein